MSKTTNKKTWLYHPVLFAIYPTISLFSHNRRFIFANQTITPILLSLIVSVTIWILFYYICKKNMIKSAIITSLSIIWFFSYGNLFEILNSQMPGKNIDMLLAPAWSLIYITGCIFYIKTRFKLNVLTVALNYVGIAILGMSLAKIGLYAYKNPSNINWENSNITSTNIQTPTLETKNNLPDIYYIILDAYAREDILLSHFNYDNSHFTKALKDKGFYLAPKSNSNYTLTYLSLTSSMNLDYHHDTLSQNIPETSSTLLPMRQILKNNKLFRFFDALNYNIVNFSSGSSYTEIKHHVDTYISPKWVLDDFQSEIFFSTPLPVLQEALKLPSSRRRRILYAFEQLGEIAKAKGPKFVFCHIIAPHEPFTFGANGEDVDHKGRDRIVAGVSENELSNYAAAYINQLIYITKRIEQSIDDILANSPKPPIIIIQGDHGPTSTLDWDNPSKQGLLEKMGILNAYYFPDKNYEKLYPTISPVNSFRIILDQYFNTPYETLPDNSIYSTLLQPYNFKNVTDTVY